MLGCLLTMHSFRAFFMLLKQFQLLGCAGLCGLLACKKDLHVGKLFVGNDEDAYMSFWRECGLDTPDVEFGIFTAWTVPDIDAELEHGESVLEKALAELGRDLALRLGLDREVKND